MFSLVTILAIFLCLNLGLASDYTLVDQWGEEGTGDGQLYTPLSIAIDSSNNIYISDWGGSSYGRVQKFSNDGKFIWSKEIDSTTRGIAIDKQGNFLYVCADDSGWGGEGRILKYSTSGDFITSWNTSVCDGVGVDENGNVYVCGRGENDHISKYNSSGQLIKEWGSYGSGNGQFNFPMSIVIDKNGNIYVSEHWGGRVQKFDNNGNYLLQWSLSDQGCGIAVDNKGYVYVGYESDGTVNKFTGEGSLITQVCKTGEWIWGSVVTVDDNYNVYLVTTESKVMKFSPSTSPEEPCPAEVVLNKSKRDTDALLILRRFRDVILAKTVEGNNYIDLYYKNAPELTTILFKNSKLKKLTKKTLKLYLPKIKSLLDDEEVIFVPRLTDELNLLFRELSKEASPELKRLLNQIKEKLKNCEIIIKK